MPDDIQLSSHVREIFEQYGVKRQYHAGEVLQAKGTLSAQAGFLVKGQLRTFCLGPSGDEISLFYLGPGNLFGSNALIDHPKVMVSVAAISPAEAYLLSADRFWTHWQESGFPPQDLMAHFIRRYAWRRIPASRNCLRIRVTETRLMPVMAAICSWVYGMEGPELAQQVCRK